MQLTWSYDGPLAGQRCAQWLEPADPYTWNDNYLCFSQRLVFSHWGPVAGYRCTQVNEPMDPHTWADNWLCSEGDEGLRFSYTGRWMGGTRVFQRAPPRHAGKPLSKVSRERSTPLRSPVNAPRSTIRAGEDIQRERTA